MVADVKRILNDYSVPYVESGSNVAKGNVNIQCPYCGEADRSQHLGINLANGFWGCWRNAQHRGRKLSRLLTALLGVTPSEARRIAGEGRHIAVQPDSYENALQTVSEGVVSAQESAHTRKIGFPPYIRRLTGRKRAERRAVDYLAGRGYHRSEIRALSKRYDLHFTIRGDMADRIVVPVYEDGELMTYLGRSIYKDAALRYRALDKEDSVKQVKDCIYNFDRAIKGGRLLFVVEGAFDVMKLDWYSGPAVTAIGLFNMNVEDSQVELLMRLRRKFDQVVGVLDAGEVAAQLRLESRLRQIFGHRLGMYSLKGAEDPGAMTERQVGRLCSKLLD